MNCFLLLFVFLISSVFADLKIKTDIAAGYREDQLDWSLGSYEHHIDFLSELKWRNITSAEISGMVAITYNSLYLRANADYGRIYSGRNRDSDYSAKGRTFEFSRSTAKSDRGEVFDLSAGVGWQFEYGQFSLIPLVGWSLDEQHLRDRKGVQVIDAENPFFEGPYDGLHDNYRAKWNGPWIGADIIYEALSDLVLKGTFEYHAFDYEGTGHWNLRRDFIRDFKQTSHGHGILSALSGEYFQNENLSWGLMGVYRKFTTQSGKDRKFILLRLRNSDGYSFDVPVQFDAPLNGVHWKSYSLKLYASYTF